MKELVFSSPYEVTAYEVYQGHLILEWPQRIDHNITAQVIHLANQINEKAKDGIQDIVPAYCSLGIFYTDHLSTESLIQLIKSIKINTHSVLKSSTKEIPVCYHPSLGIDIEYLCEVHSLTHKELIDLHSKPTYRVSFLGFLPGFLYLSGLKDQLITPRRAVPRTQLLPGSVGIGGNQTGIYPIESPVLHTRSRSLWI